MYILALKCKGIHNFVNHDKYKGYGCTRTHEFAKETRNVVPIIKRPILRADWPCVGTASSHIGEVPLGIGTKNYGESIGIIYPHRFSDVYLSTTIEPHPGYLKLNEQCKREWGDHNTAIGRIGILEMKTILITFAAWTKEEP